MPIYKGNTKIVKLYKGTTQIVKRYKGIDLIYSASRLPAEFQEVEFLESSGTQYIDTGIAPNERLNYPVIDETVIEWTQTNNNYQFNGWGVANRSHYGINSRGYYDLEGGVSSQTYAIGTKRKLIATYEEYDLSLDISNSETITRTGTSPVVIPTAGNYSLLGTTYCYAKLYSTKISIQGTLVRNFVPCYRKADNVAGLYDLVNGVFYTNAGTGTFIVGGNV